ncbi:hypothetical protein B4Q04_10490 [Zobellia sp. OII3]|uniref:hypothetical protein n=1 Tax=Zobellia sp. OII3 TaxID=2034520 RepID=UPI000B530757|nr:hypothetical protein [Zobellia sp. OII3]OWW25998.1 hypothetical protein B4Q04_10490 [Zobellia sp. OII3]
MKKLFVFSLLVLMLACDEKDEADDKLSLPLNGDHLIEQIDVVYSNNISFSKNYYYGNDNELSEVRSLNGNEEYTYKDGFITKIKYTALPSGAIDERFFTYNNEGKLTEETKLYYTKSVGERIVFSYPDETTVTFERYGGDLNAQNSLQAKGIYDLEAGSFNILKLTETTIETPQTRVLSYSYDNKKSVTHGIKDNMKGFEYLFSGENNVTAYSFKLNDLDVYSYSSTFMYNNDIYPSKESQTDQDGAINTYTFYYQ